MGGAKSKENRSKFTFILYNCAKSSVKHNTTRLLFFLCVFLFIHSFINHIKASEILTQYFKKWIPNRILVLAFD